MSVPRRAMLFIVATSCLALSVGRAVATDAPRVGRPVTVPSTAMPALPPAQIDNSLLIGGEDINAKRSNTRMTVEVHVNGKGPYRFLVDSGADTSVVGLKVARELQLPLGTPAVLHATTASARVDRVMVQQLTLGSSVINDLELPALDERDVGGEGMIGIDALVQQRLMLDFEKRIIKSEDARQPAKTLDGEIIVTARRRRGQLILTEVSAIGLPVEAVIDTGSEITIGNLALRDRLIRGNRKKFETIQAMGVTGVTVELQLARIAELKVGSVTLYNVPMAFADVPPFQVFGLQDQPSLLLGTDLLSTFRRVSLDFRARKVRFQLKQCGSSGIIIDAGQATAFSRISSGNDATVCRR